MRGLIHHAAMAGVVVAFGLSPAMAKVAPRTLYRVVHEASLIALVEIQSVRKGEAGAESALARVLEVWKGEHRLGSIELDLTDTWACDLSSSVEAGEAVLFAEGPRDDGLWRVSFSGRGWMPVRNVPSGVVAEVVAGEVRLPEGMRTTDVGAREGWKDVVSVASLRTYVGEVKGQSAPTTKE